ncbi:hypothetical protein CHS0354_020692 [Potamilus streckersoni]|uniref:Uncharacterized protein n=1 Tax=Potamilus streckersoni TaxID=2493646 RepID=A0AAE0WCC5_9BIVA|nr:hypothetical protein CHS0354_020692 [Potamilus streckersoni]
MEEKMKSQLHFYCNLVGEKYERTETTTLEVEFSLRIHSMLSLSLSELGKVATTTSTNTLPLTCFQHKKKCQVQKLDVIDLQVPTGNTLQCYDVTFLPGDRVMLAVLKSNQCILLSSSHWFITSHTLTSEPWNVCVLDDDQKVAVSLYNKSKIQILSVVVEVIRPVRTITTKYNCAGIEAAGKGEMVVNGYCDKNKSQWSLITTSGEVKCSHQYDSADYSNSYVALNNMETRIYVTIYMMDSLLCFDMEGRKQFTYSPENLGGPFGVAVDRYENIYVLRFLSDKIHQLSPDGSVIQEHLKQIIHKTKVNADTIQKDKADILHHIHSLIAKLQKLEDDIIVSLERNYKSENLNLQAQENRGSSLIIAIHSDLTQLELFRIHGSEVQKFIMLHNLDLNQSVYFRAISEYQMETKEVRMLIKRLVLS